MELFKMSRLIVAGDGHGAKAVYLGLLESGFKPTICTNDPDLITLAEINGCRSSSIENWISDPSDLVVSGGYRPRIEPDLLNRCRFINIHYALLPRYRGMHATVWAILNGEPEVGYTVHEMDEWLDSGPVLHQTAVPVGPQTSWELMLELDRLVQKEIGAVVQDYLSGTINPAPQNENDAIYVARRNLEDCRIDWERWSATYFERALRALVPPYPRPFFDRGSNRYEIVEAEILFKNYIEIPGHVVYRDSSSVYVKIDGGLLRIIKLENNCQQLAALDVIPRIGIRLSSESAPRV